MIVPSMSEMTIWSVHSLTNSLAPQAATLVGDSEKVTEFAPGLRCSDFYGHILEGLLDNFLLKRRGWQDRTRPKGVKNG